MLEIESLLSAAKDQTGLSDFGDLSFREGLTILLRSLNTEAKLSERGEQIIAGSITATLANRLKVEDYLRANPHLLEAPVEKPLFLFGLPRTGTTLAINLLTSDPARRYFTRWEAFSTVPPAAPGEVHTDPRCVAEQARLEASLAHMPHIAAMHWENADSSTECQFAMSPTFCSQVYDSQYHMPSYTDWFLNADYAPAFRYHKRLMQLLQGNNPGRWTFKNPWHPLYLDALTGEYPDAQLVMTHRDPVDTVASACSLVYAVRKMFSNEVDPVEIGKTLTRTFDTMIARVEAYEAKHGVGSIHHIQYADMMADPIGTIQGVYAKFGEPFSAEAEAAMRKSLADNPKGKHGKHEYRLEDYGLTADGIIARYAGYCERFGIIR